MADGISMTTSGMRNLLYVASALVFVIGIPLLFAPHRTDIWFSWTVNPPLTAAFLGAAYWSSFLLEFLCARERLWARSRIAIPTVLLFTILTLVATLLHIDKFHFGNAFEPITRQITWVWLIVYAAVPVIMAAILVLQIRRGGEDPPSCAPIPGWSRFIFGFQALVMIGLGAALFAFPKPVSQAVWPWLLSPLTARAIGAWLVGIGFAAVHVVYENDWWRAGNALVAYTVFAYLQLFILLLMAGERYPSGDPVIDWGGLQVLIYILFLLSVFGAGLHGWMASRKALSAAT